tara:strand:+ start:2529 stop:3098 length:570 start_codon:yes stop_codon:yes gene_type:complete
MGNINEKLYDKKSGQKFIFINNATCKLKNKINEQQLKIAYFMIKNNKLKIYVYNHKIIKKKVKKSEDVTGGKGFYRGRGRIYTMREEEKEVNKYKTPFLFATVPLFGEILVSRKKSCIQVKIKKYSWNKVMKTSLEKLSACFTDDTYEVEYLGFDDKDDSTYILYLTPENKDFVCSYIEDYTIKNNLKF